MSTRGTGTREEHEHARRSTGGTREECKSSNCVTRAGQTRETGARGGEGVREGESVHGGRKREGEGGRQTHTEGERYILERRRARGKRER